MFMITFLMGWEVSSVLRVEEESVVFCVVLCHREYFSFPFSPSAGLMGLRIPILKRHWSHILEF